MKAIDMERQARVRQIKDNQKEFWTGTSGRVLRTVPEIASFSRIAVQAARETQGAPEAIRKTRRLQLFATQFPAVPDRGQLLTGSRRFGCPQRPQEMGEEEFRALGICGNHGHLIADYGALLQEGVATRLERLKRFDAQGDERQRRNRICYAQVQEAFLAYILHHAQEAEAAVCNEIDQQLRDELQMIASNCKALIDDRPHTFAQALQLLWFAHTFVFAEGFASAFSFGRFDQFLWPFLRDDLAAGRLTIEQAKDWLTCFWLKCCEGCESQNLTLGGVDENGKLAENPLSLLCLEVAAELRTHQPSLSVRICTQTTEAFWAAALRVCAQGDGQPSFVCDEVTIDGLCKLGIPLTRARDWGIVGCYEPSTQGDCGAFTVASSMNLPAEFRSFFDRADGYPDFDAYYQAFLAYLRNRLPEWVCGWELAWAQKAATASPFESVCVTGCVESGLTVEEGGARCTLFGLNILGFGTVVDSLLAIRRFVYEEKQFSLAALREAVMNDFPEEAAYYLCRNLPGRYGTADMTSCRLAGDFSRELGGLLAGTCVGGVARLNPALFLFSADIMRGDIPATPDGRRKGEPCSYGVGPFAAGGHFAPTQVLAAAASVDHTLYADGTPLMLAFTRADFAGGDGMIALRGLITHYFRQGGFQLQFNAVDAEEMRRARAQPAKYSHLLVRVSGYSAKFTAVDPHWQDVLIQRAEQGL